MNGGREILMIIVLSTGMASGALAQMIPGQTADPTGALESSRYRREAMRAAYAAVAGWQQGWGRDDLGEVLATYTDDALLLLPGAAEPVRGKAGISHALAGHLPLVGPIAVSLGDGDVADSAVYLFGRYFSGEDADTGRTETGTYVMLLRREGRQWRIRAQTFRADPAGAEGDAES